MENHTIRLGINRGQPCLIPAHDSTTSKVFTFQLAFRPERYGEREFEHWWIDIRTIYRQRRQKAINFDPLINLWWNCCLENDSIDYRGVCESFLLTKLFERMRSNGSKRVLIDSLPAKGKRGERAEIVDNLETMLKNSSSDEIGISDFSTRTADFVGPPKFEKDVFDLQNEFAKQLFDEPVKLLQSNQAEAAIAASIQVWDNWHRRYGRHANMKLEKLAMDILSYEARAAIHRCYSHFWDFVTRDFLPNVRSCSKASCVFHRFWHLDILFRAKEFADRDFHLFHGHILGLHPGTHFFLQTETGRRLVGDWISVAPIDWQYNEQPESAELRRLLNGLFVAIADYSNRNDITKYMRQESSGQMPDQFDISDAVADGGAISRISRNRRRSKRNND